MPRKNTPAAPAASLQTRLLDLMRAPRYQPLTKSGLARALDLRPEERSALRALLRDLEADGTILFGRKALYTLKGRTTDTLTGTISFLRTGGAHFVPDRQDPENRGPLLSLGLPLGEDTRLYVPAKDLGNALPGDTIIGKVSARRFEPGELEARVIKVIRRSERPLVGTLVKRGRDFAVRLDQADLPEIVRLEGTPAVDHGNKVLCVIETWDNPERPPFGRIEKDLGPADAVGMAITAIVHRLGIRVEFPPEVLAETDAISEKIPASEIAAREDWRSREVITIDPFDAKDFDDAISVDPLPGGGWELAVHIADVSHYVRPGSALDAEAMERGNSTYLADRVIPMLPEKLSNGICSLQPGVERLTRCAVITFDAKCRRTHSRFCRAIIKSRRRFTYEEAFAELEACGAINNPDAPYADQSPDTAHLHRAWKLAYILRQARFRAGSLDLDFPEVRAVLDKNGTPLRLARIVHDESHQLIEEFMLAANEAVAHAFKSAAMPAIYRVHEDPDPAKLLEYRDFLHTCGLPCGDLTHRPELQRVISLLAGRPDAAVLKLGLLKSLKRAAYHPDPLGHFGLAKNDYTHFTSPIRRYADLVVHRVLWNWMLKHGTAAVPSPAPHFTPPAPAGASGKKPAPHERMKAARQPERGKPGKHGKPVKPAPAEPGPRAPIQRPESLSSEGPMRTPPHQKMAAIAEHLSITERTSAEAESDSQRLKQTEYFAGLIKGPKPPRFTATVTDPRRMGLFVELTDLPIRGLVRIEDLPPAPYKFDQSGPRWTSRKPARTYQLGTPVTVVPIKADIEKRMIDFKIVG